MWAIDLSIIHFRGCYAMKKEKKTEAITTFLGADTHIEGTIRFEKSLRIDGSAKGTIVSASGAVIVGQNANIEAEISVDSAIIMGIITGSVKATRKIEIRAPAIISGNLEAPSIAIDAGVRFDGHCVTDVQKKVASLPKESQKQAIIKEKKGE
jgi:cytoskeletal protein CcmA (bactofilin family)